MDDLACSFCRIIRGDAPAEILFRDDEVLAFRDIHPVAPVHVLIIPVRHVSSVREPAAITEVVLPRMFSVARDLAGREDIAAGGYRLVINTGPDAGQTVLHLHMHLIGGRRMSWPPG